MAWIKIPKENHAVFYERLPEDKRIQTLQMFGAAAAKVNGHLFGGLFARSFMVKLGDADHAEALALDGAERFDPMGNGGVMSNSVLMPESMMDEPDEMRAWLRRAFDYTVTLPAKKAVAKKATTKKATTKKVTTKAPTKKATTKTVTKAAKKPASRSRSAARSDRPRPAQKRSATRSRPKAR